jgi:endogenous inhibitor of DNA gyrase (YacG/DUF329 family)
MTQKNCKICNKIIKANKTKSIYCSNKCKQINYLQKKKEKQAIQEPTETQIFLHQQEIEGWQYLSELANGFTDTLINYTNSRIKERQDELEAREQREFQRNLFLFSKRKKTKKLQICC